MVRPIEISDSLSKVQAVEQMQQDAKTRPEAMQQFQKSLTAKQTEQLTSTPNPVPETDHVEIHVDEQEKDKRKTAEDNQDEKDKRNEEKSNREGSERKNDDQGSTGHIDIKV